MSPLLSLGIFPVGSSHPHDTLLFLLYYSRSQLDSHSFCRGKGIIVPKGV